MNEVEYDKPAVCVTLTYGAVWQIIFAVTMGNILTGIIIGLAYVTHHK